MGAIFRAIKGIISGPKKGPSAAEIAREERARVERENQEKQRRQQEQSRLDLEEDQKRRAAFRSSALSNEEENLGRKSILGG